MTQKCSDDGVCLKRMCSSKLADNANGNIITKTGVNNEAGYEIGKTANFICHSGFYHPKNWRQSSETVICLQTDDNKSEKWQPIDGSSLTPCVKGKKNLKDSTCRNKQI